MQGGARAVDLPARPFDLARPGVVRHCVQYCKGGSWW